MSQGQIRRLETMVASAIIILPLTLQILASFTITFGPIERSPFMWPFVDYPMYREAHYSGEPIQRQMVVGILGDSTEVAIVPDDLGVNFWQFQSLLNPAILSGDRARADNYRRIYENRHGRRLIGFRLEDRPLIITAGGLREGPPTVLGSLYFVSD